MATFNKYLRREVIGRSWQQLQRSLVSEQGRLRQLITLQPIDLYDTHTTLEVSGASVKMEIRSYLENMLKREDSGPRFWPFRIFSSTPSDMSYKFNVVVDGRMDFKNVEIWVRNNFKDKLFSFHHGRYHLKLRDVRQISERNGKLLFDLDLFGSIRIWKFRIRMKSILTIEAVPLYDTKANIIRVKDLDYQFETPNLLLRLLDRYYHRSFRHFLEEVIEISIREDLFTARIMAQEEMNRHQSDEKLIFHGFLDNLELERILIEQRGIGAVFLATGRIQLNR